MIELQTGAYPETKSAVADRASALGLPSQTLHRFLQLKESSAAPSAREVRELYADYMKIVAQAAALAQEVKHGMAH